MKKEISKKIYMNTSLIQIGHNFQKNRKLFINHFKPFADIYVVSRTYCVSLL